MAEVEPTGEEVENYQRSVSPQKVSAAMDRFFSVPSWIKKFVNPTGRSNGNSNSNSSQSQGELVFFKLGCPFGDLLLLPVKLTSFNTENSSECK